MRRSAVVLVLGVCCGLTHFANAQSSNASVTGLVTDPSKAVLVGAKVSAINEGTNVRYQGATNSSGSYYVTGLPPGVYRVEVEKTGFKTVLKPAVALHVQDTIELNFEMAVGSSSETVTVEAGAPLVNTTDAAVSTVVDRQFAENLPMNGRSFQTLIQLTPGVVLTTSSTFSDGQFSINGQRATSNYWMVDGVSANIGMSSTAGATDTLSGSLGGFSAQGGTNSLVSVDALQEFRIQTSTFAPEFGRTPGGQISIVTRSGGNQFHGTVFDYLRNDVLDANDWFLDRANLPKGEERQNDFGGTLSGPILKNRTFFFFSYEGLRLRLPQSGISTVPDLNARQSPAATPAVQPFLNAYPLPNGAEVLDGSGNPTGTAAFNVAYSNRSTLDAASLRLDHKLNDKLTFFARYNYAPSELLARPGPQAGFALSELDATRVNTQTTTAGITWARSPTLTNDFRANYSHVSSGLTTSLDNFGGATPIGVDAFGLPSPYTPQNSSALFGIDGFTGTGLVGAQFDINDGARNLQRQLNIVNTTSIQTGAHSLKFGVDYRRLTPRVTKPSYSQQDTFFSLADTQSASVDFAEIVASSPVPLILKNLSFFGQDTWRVHSHFTLTYGLRWDIDFAPKASSGLSLPAVENFNDASTIALAPAGTPVFGTRYGNLAPRIGIAYQFPRKAGRETVLRGGWGLFYDLVTAQFQALPSGYPFGSTTFQFGPIPFPLDPATTGAPQPPSVQGGNALLFAYDPHIKSPYTQEWNVALEQSLGGAQSVSLSYLGAIGRRLLVGEQYTAPNANIFAANLTGNYGTSDYHAFQTQFQRHLSGGLQAIASFSWSHSIDTGSTGAGGVLTSDFYSRQLGAQANRGASDFDIRRSLTGALTYDIPSPKLNRVATAVLQHWSLENIFQARSAPPVDVNYFNFSTLASETVPSRPNVTPNIPLYLYGSQYPGGKAFNNTIGAVAGGCPDGSQSVGPFCPPPFGMEGNLGRNALRGFGAWQWDFAAHRDFALGEQVKLQFRAELFNILNHPNFGQPFGSLAYPPIFGVSSQTLGQSLNFSNLGSGGFDPLYQFGGPRSVQFALKVSF